jgi:hypothetical protein
MGSARARMQGPALQTDMRELGHERLAACLVWGDGPRREYGSGSLLVPVETR